ncbi:unnamed protein product [Hydatigera taeniaeformis]|uniref:Uncharacterized protein n=1 Tax=Hydatigena taeniaeformis TaxID=6205 RepID=A0A0R3WHU0_HYDTA|nr:unnamed protein product [Hydatigera taeniaeformis]
MGGVSAPMCKAHQDCEFSPLPTVQKLKLLDIDPRSPTDGIVRTPIILDKTSNNEGLQPFIGRLPFDTSDFESIDGCITEDDSVHNARNTSALSDNTVSTNNIKGQKKGVLTRVRRSLMSRRVHNSPSLMVKLRQREKIEHSKQQYEQIQKYRACQEGEGVLVAVETKISKLSSSNFGEN